MLHEVGKRLDDLVDNLARFDAVETLIHEEQSKSGKPLTHLTRKYSYVAVVSPPPGKPLPEVPDISESRLSLSGLSDFPGGIGTVGLPTLAFVFHRNMRENFEFDCEGLGEWEGQSAWLIRFRQRDDHPNYLQHYRIGENRYPVALQGRAWLAAKTSQVIHMQADLVRPMPEIKLLVQRYLVDYGSVKFQSKNADLWLPKNAELYFHFRGHRYYRRHTFEEFRLFSTDTTEKVTAPKVQDESLAEPPGNSKDAPPPR